MGARALFVVFVFLALGCETGVTLPSGVFSCTTIADCPGDLRCEANFCIRGDVDAGPLDAALPDAGPPDAGPMLPDGCVPSAEICDGVDNDCNGATPDGVDDPMVGTACDGDGDLDMCADGTYACAAGEVACSDVGPDLVETCNAMNDDCDTAVDEGGGCPCNRRTQNARTYLVCTGADGSVIWQDALANCRALGYDLATVNDAAEDTFVTGLVPAAGGLFIGLNDRDTEATLVWSSGAPYDYNNFQAGQPDNFMNEDCVRLQSTGWDDYSCAMAQDYLCEAP